jgi:hypothetical protein|tara:strand:+ start:318 stop:461 length:144 start_codon:yes stop_codon:yes gene_type:complete
MIDLKTEVPTWQELGLALLYLLSAIIFGVYLAVIILLEVSFLLIQHT